MGNRAVITQSKADNAPVVYLHWNGGRASVQGMLAAARELGLNGSGEAHMDLFAAFLAAKFFECKVGTTVDRETYGQADTNNYDNGVYVIDENFKIVERLYAPQQEEIDPEKTEAIRKQLLGIKDSEEEQAA